LIGGHNYYTFGVLSGFLCSFVSIFVERPSRRILLAIYCANVASHGAIVSMARNAIQQNFNFKNW
jgi:hypothetical protein